MSLILAAAHLAAIEDGARAAWPAEACGLLIGGGDGRRLVVDAVLPAANLRADTSDRFELDPRVRLAAEKSCRGTGRRVLGHWHSHPNGRARPSATDLAMAFEPELVWLIVAATGPDAPCRSRAFRPDPTAGRFRPIALRVVPAEKVLASQR